MTRRFVKQLLYGAGFLLFFSAIGLGLYGLLFKAPATCFDNKQNGTETGIDCGGGCAPCGIKYAKDIIADSIDKYPVGSSKTVVVAHLTNPNEDYGLSDFVYTLSAKDDAGKTIKEATGHSFIYDSRAKGMRYLVDVIDTDMKTITDMTFAYGSPQYGARADFVEPNIQQKEFTTDISGLSKTMAPVYIFNKDLMMKSKGVDVQALEEFLQKHGLFNKTPDTTFDLDTKLALIKYQQQKKIKPSTGIFSGTTRTKVNAEEDRVQKITIAPDASVAINGSVKNADVVDASNVVVVGFLYDSTGTALSVSKTELNNVKATEQRSYRIVFPRTVAVDKIDTTKTKIFIDAIR